MTQTFRQFPEPEYNWNIHDEVLLGNMDLLPESVKPKRLRYAIIPEVLKTIEEINTYYNNFKELLLYLQRTYPEGFVNDLFYF
jgi:hypothetical protein